MGVADQAVRGGQQVECGLGLGRVEQVLDYRCAQAAVDEGEGRHKGDLGQLGQEALFVGVELPGSPPDCGEGGPIEVGGVDDSRGGVVVVAGDGLKVELTQSVQAPGGVGSVADEIAEAPDDVEAAVPFGVGNNGIEGFDVGVDVGDDQSAQGYLGINRRAYVAGRWGIIATVCSILAD